MYKIIRYSHRYNTQSIYDENLSAEELRSTLIEAGERYGINEPIVTLDCPEDYEKAILATAQLASTNRLWAKRLQVLAGYASERYRTYGVLDLDTQHWYCWLGTYDYPPTAWRAHNDWETLKPEEQDVAECKSDK